MYKHSPVLGPENFVIRNCKFNSHLHRRPQATSRKAKRNMKKSDIRIQIMKPLLLSKNRSISERTKSIRSRMVTRGALERGAWSVGRGGGREWKKTKVTAVTSSVWPQESSLKPLSLILHMEVEIMSSCFTDFEKESFNQVRT